MVTFRRNSLKAVAAGVEPFSEFMKKFVGSTVTIWTGMEPTLYSIDRMSRFIFVTDPDMLIIIGSNPDVKFSVPLGNGFGLKVKGDNSKFWIDKFNAAEAVVIMYEADGKGEK